MMTSSLGMCAAVRRTFTLFWTFSFHKVV